MTTDEDLSAVIYYGRVGDRAEGMYITAYDNGDLEVTTFAGEEEVDIALDIYDVWALRDICDNYIQDQAQFDGTIGRPPAPKSKATKPAPEPVRPTERGKARATVKANA